MKFLGKKKYLVSISVLCLLFFFTANFCLASLLKPGTSANIGKQAIESAEFGYETTADIYYLAQIVINAFLSIIGVLLLVYLLTAGYKWMTAHGEEEKVTEAKDTIKRAIVGVIIIVAAYAISIFVMSKLEAGTLRSSASDSIAPIVLAVSL